jgi:anti-sigma factor RsiW
MAAEPHPHTDIERLNAFVDGELAPAERALLAERLATDRDFARAHAILARLKACVSEIAGDEPAQARSRQRASWGGRLPAASLAGLTVTGLAVAGLAAIWIAAPAPPPGPGAPRHAAITLAALPADPVVPHLDRAGLTLVGVVVENPGPVVVATYRGPRGCRLDLHAAAAGHAFPDPGGTRRHGWTAGALVYQLVAFGMPEERFRIVAETAERATRGAPDEGPLREARLSRPCIG